MESTTNTASASESDPKAAAPPLRRPLTGRVFAGVAVGIAQRFEVPVWLIRLLFIVFSFGGFGVAVYLAAWLLIPREDRDQSIAQDWIDRIQGGQNWVGLVLIGLAVLIVSDRIGFFRTDLTLAVILIVVGVLLYRGDLRPGRSVTTGADPQDDPSTPRKDSDMPATLVDSDSTTGEGGDLPPPPPPPSPRPASRPRKPARPPSILGRLTVGVVFVVLGVMAFADLASDVFDPTLRHYTAAAALVIGAGLLVGTWFGRSRGLIVLGVLLLPVLLTSPLVEFDYTGEVGDVDFSPTTIAELQTYRHGVGQMVIDLTNLRLGGATAEVTADLGIGEMIIIVPDDVRVEASARVGIGQVEIGPSDRGGIGVGLSRTLEGGNGGLVIDAEANIGHVDITTRSRTAVGLLSDDTYRVTAEANLASSYSKDVGDLTLDLRGLNVTDDRTVAVEVGAGTITVLVSDDLAVDVDASVGVGRLDLFGDERSGLGLEDSVRRGTGSRLDLRLEVGSGDIIVEGGRR